MKPTLGAIAAAIALAFSSGTLAQSMSKDEHKTSKDKIEADAKAARASCDKLAGNAKDVCQAEAKAREKIDKADLEARFKNTDKARYDAQVAKADADYSVAKEKCDDKSGKEKDACVKEAKAAQASAKANARAQRADTKGAAKRG